MWMAILPGHRQRRHAGGDPPSSAWRLLMHLLFCLLILTTGMSLFEFYFVILALYGFVPATLSLALMVLTRNGRVLAPFEVPAPDAEERSPVVWFLFGLAYCSRWRSRWLLSLTTTLEVFLKSAFWFQDRLEWKIFWAICLTLAPLYYTTRPRWRRSFRRARWCLLSA